MLQAYKYGLCVRPGARLLCCGVGGFPVGGCETPGRLRGIWTFDGAALTSREVLMGWLDRARRLAVRGRLCLVMRQRRRVKRG